MRIEEKCRPLLSAFAQAAQNSHRAFSPDAVFLILERVDVQQPPAGPQQPVHFLAAFRFQVMSRQFRNVQLPQGQGFQNFLRHVMFDGLVQLFMSRRWYEG
jgi:hypothetical protein